MANSKDMQENLSKLSQMLVDDLLSTSDADFSLEISQNPELQQQGVLAKTAYQDALHSVGKKRLQTAKQQLKLISGGLLTTKIDAAMAHKILAKLASANDGQITMAARNLKTISDSEALELVSELIELGALDKDELS